jgi:tetratricopeptide (TPR) repeat protein
MDKDTSEIAKLTERLSKDPKSKLFVPLAEEYKKAGDREMSIHVLTEGLKNNPGYVTARSLLGKLLFETGDLAGAQKEFEEVVKAIPDNLMAQRKLGDLYISQGRPADALTHYKTVLTLNPKDQETASLVSDIEAGRDVKARIAIPKPQAPEEPAKKQESPQAVAPAVTKPQQSPVPGGQARPVPEPVATEEPEEVLIVEPLEAAESVNLEQALAMENLGPLSEPAQEPSLEAFGEESAVFFEQPHAAEEPQMPGEAESLTGMEFPGEEPPGAPPAEAMEPEKAADDFTTDTLAELYIAQGFFEKAVDIYERMLVDNPESQGLKNKLADVRAMAAQAAPAAEPMAESEPFAVPNDLVTGPGMMESPAADMTAGIFNDAELSSAQEIELPKPENAWNPPTELPEHAAEEALSKSAVRQTKPAEPGFEPVEYMPPDTAPLQGPESTSGEAVSATIEKDVSPPRRPSASGRKETIDRLENWLHNIIKEK